MSEIYSVPLDAETGINQDRTDDEINKMKADQLSNEDDYYNLEQKLRRERSAKRLIPAEEIAKNGEWIMKEELRRERNDPRIVLKGPPSKKRNSDSSIFADADFEAVKKRKEKSHGGLSSRVKKRIL